MNDTDDAILLAIWLDGSLTPRGISDQTGANRGYVNTRLRQQLRENRVRKPTRGVYSLTDKGREDLIARTGVPVSTVLANQVVEGDLSALGWRETLVFRFTDGSVVAFEADDEVDSLDSLSIELDPVETWDDRDDVLDDVDDVRIPAP